MPRVHVVAVRQCLASDGVRPKLALKHSGVAGWCVAQPRPAWGKPDTLTPPAPVFAPPPRSPRGRTRRRPNGDQNEQQAAGDAGRGVWALSWWGSGSGCAPRAPPPHAHAPRLLAPVSRPDGLPARHAGEAAASPQRRGHGASWDAAQGRMLTKPTQDYVHRARPRHLTAPLLVPCLPATCPGPRTPKCRTPAGGRPALEAVGHLQPARL